MINFIQNLFSHHPVKRFKLATRRMLHNFHKKIIHCFPFLLFLISILLFISIVFPNIFAHVIPISRIGYTRVLTISGDIYSIDDKEKKIITNVELCIGGYKTSVDSNGHYNLIFTSKSISNIPVTILSKDEELVLGHELISFNNCTYILEKDFLLTKKEPLCNLKE